MIEREKLPSIAITLIVFSVVIAVGFSIVGNIDDGIQENNQHFERYCEERFGDQADVWVGGGQGAHSGLHCSNAVGTTTVHLGQIPLETWESYKRGEASTAEVTESIQPIGPMGMVQTDWTSLLGATAAIVLVTVLLGFLRRRGPVESEPL